MRSTATRHAVLGTVAVVAVLAVQPVVGAQPTSDDPCAGASDAELPDGVGVPTYVDGFEGGTAAAWTGGEVVPIGSDGRCSLGAVAGSNATLTEPVNASGSAVVGTLDVAEGGGLRLLATDGSDAAVALRNRGRASDRGIELVVRNDSGAVAVRRNLTTETGRFFAFRLTWDTDGTVRLNRGTLGSAASNAWEVETATTTDPDGYRVQLDAEAYLDRIGLVRVPADAGATTTETDYPWAADGPPESGVDGPPEDTDDGSDYLGIGLFLLLFGLPGAVFPYELARLGEQIDAIGSTTPAEEVEPADWNVTLTRMICIVMAAFGVLTVAIGVL